MSADVISLLVAWQLAVTLHSHRAGMEMARMVLSYLSQLWLGRQHIYHDEPTLQFGGIEFGRHGCLPGSLCCIDFNHTF